MGIRLAVFGDSFAEIKRGFKGTSNERYHWPSIVAETLNVDKYENFALGGTSLDWSYMNFIQFYKEYDIIIFVVTGSYRSSVIQEYPAHNYKHIFSFFANESLEFNKRLNHYIFKTSDGSAWENPIDNLINLKILKNELYKYKHYSNVYELTHKAMRDSIIYRRSDTILIDAFSSINHPLWTKEDVAPAMYNIQIADFHSNGYFDKSKWSEIENKLEGSEHQRFCHLSKAQNEKFAEYVIKHINENNFDIHETLHINSIQKFYQLSKL